MAFAILTLNTRGDSHVCVGQALCGSELLCGTRCARYGSVAEARIRILVVEPNGDWHDLINFVLAGCGYDIVNAQIDLNVTDQAEASHPDLILLDLGPDDKRSEGILRQLKTNPLTREIPVITETAAGEEERARHAMAAGAEQVLYKPYDLGDLPNIVQKKAGIKDGSRRHH
jgi:CheY-like chemotaxis protein